MRLMNDWFKNRFFLIGLVVAFAVILAAASIGIYIVKSKASGRLPAIVLKKHAAGGYTFFVDGKPYIVRGVCYLPVPVGETYDYNFWGHPEIWKTDGKLMKQLGVNTVRFYREGENAREVRTVIDGLYRKFGIRSLMGHDLGFWDLPPPNYGMPQFREKVLNDVLGMVRRYKDQAGILAWVLGNENNYSFEVLGVQSWSTPELEAIADPDERVEAKAEIYYSFVNDLAREVKKIDPIRPVVMGVGEVKSLKVANRVCSDVDILGMIVYRGPGFGNLFSQIKRRFDRPVLLIEWGADSFDVVNQKVVEDTQAQFLKFQWQDIMRNTAGSRGIGNCIGGTLFEWHDEWWKGNEHVPQTWNVHDKDGQFTNAAYYYDYDEPGRLNMNEEWYGIVRLVPKGGPKGIDRREPKEAYRVLKELWK